MEISWEPALTGRSRRRAVQRADYFDGSISLLAFLKANPVPSAESVTGEFVISSEGNPADRKARADELAARLGATAQWRNGYYVATLQGVEIHFDPPIFARDIDGSEPGKAA